MLGTARSDDGIPLTYEVLGSGSPALVFVHGWSCDRSYWKAQMAHFSSWHRVVAIDLAGHGDSGLGRATWTMPDFGRDIAAVVEQLDLKQVVLIGHSMGGDAIVDAALELPGRVAGLVWVDVYDTLGEPRPAEEVDEFVSTLRKDFVSTTREVVGRSFLPSSDPDLADWVAADMSAAPPEVAIDVAKHSIGNDGPILTLLRRLTVPVVAINFGHRPTDIEALRRYGVMAVVMEGVGHFGMMEDPDKFNRLLRSTINSFVKAAR